MNQTIPNFIDQNNFSTISSVSVVGRCNLTSLFQRKRFTTLICREQCFYLGRLHPLALAWAIICTLKAFPLHCLENAIGILRPGLTESIYFASFRIKNSGSRLTHHSKLDFPRFWEINTFRIFGEHQCLKIKKKGECWSYCEIARLMFFKKFKKNEQAWPRKGRVSKKSIVRSALRSFFLFRIPFHHSTVEKASPHGADRWSDQFSESRGWGTASRAPRGASVHTHVQSQPLSMYGVQHCKTKRHGRCCSVTIAAERPLKKSIRLWVVGSR